MSITACQNAPTQNATLIPSKTGNDRYSVSGLVMVGDVYDGITKPYVEQGLAYVCPAGLKYIDYLEAPNKKTPFGTWMQWRGTVECQ